jgi:hypothetical protein
LFFLAGPGGGRYATLRDLPAQLAEGVAFDSIPFLENVFVGVDDTSSREGSRRGRFQRLLEGIFNQRAGGSSTPVACDLADLDSGIAATNAVHRLGRLLDTLVASVGIMG